MLKTKFLKYKDWIILYTIIFVAVVLLIVGITLTALGAPEYKMFVANAIAKGKSVINISQFVYGIFLLVLSGLLLILLALFTNSAFNKKLRNNE
ncbi:hypothetical protein ACXYRQ_03150 [Mycoplasma sp. 394]